MAYIATSIAGSDLIGRPQGNWNMVPTFKEGSSEERLAMRKSATRGHRLRGRDEEAGEVWCKVESRLMWNYLVTVDNTR